MKFREIKLEDACIIEIEPIKDKRGYFVRSFCEREFKEHNLNLKISQTNISFNKKKDTLRGMHYQVFPYAETKLVSCIKGSIYDVIIDLRKKSNTYCKWFGIELNDKNNRMLYVPKGFAHGFQTLKDNSVVLYQMSGFYRPEFAKGIRWNDQAFNIKWPNLPSVISDKDLEYLDFKH